MTSVAQRLYSMIHSTPIRRVSAYKQTLSFEDRQQAYHRFHTKYPDRIPIVCDLALPGLTSSSSDSIKLSLPSSSSITISKLQQSLRHKLNLEAHQAIYLFVLDQHGYYVSPSLEKYVDEIYTNHRDEDGMLYIVYSTEVTYGCENRMP